MQILNIYLLWNINKRKVKKSRDTRDDKEEIIEKLIECEMFVSKEISIGTS